MCMFELEFFISLMISAVIVYFIRKKLAARKKVKEDFAPLRQKDIKKSLKKEKRLK